MHEKLKVIILAAGKGVRMQSDEPKALTIFRGKPFLQHLLDTIKSLDSDLVPIIVVGHQKERIKKLLGDKYIYAEQKEQLGTGHAVAVAKSALDTPHEAVLVLSADQPLISKETLTDIIKTHFDKKPTITIGTVVVPNYEDWRAGLYSNFGRIIRDVEGRVSKIVEFKSATEEERKVKEVNPAIYVFDAKWLWENIDKIEMDKAKGEYKLTDLAHIARDRGKIIEAVPVKNVIEGLQPNSKEELETLEKVAKNLNL